MKLSFCQALTIVSSLSREIWSKGYANFFISLFLYFFFFFFWGGGGGGGGAKV